MSTAAVVFTYKEPPEMVLNCLESLYSQLDEMDIVEVILNSGNSKETEKRIIKEFNGRKPTLSLLHKKPSGKRAAINDAIRILKDRHKFIVFIDGDVVIRKGTIPMLVRYVKSHNECGVCAGIPIVKERKGFTAKCFKVAMDIYNTNIIKRFNEKSGSNEFYESVYVIRSSLLEFLPKGCINEGEFFTKKSREKGYKIVILKDSKYCMEPILKFSEYIKYKKRIKLGTKKSEELFGYKNKFSTSGEVVEYLYQHPGEVIYVIALILMEVVVDLSMKFFKNQPELWETTMKEKVQK